MLVCRITREFGPERLAPPSERGAKGKAMRIFFQRSSYETKKVSTFKLQNKTANKSWKNASLSRSHFAKNGLSTKCKKSFGETTANQTIVDYWGSVTIGEKSLGVKQLSNGC